MKLFGTLEPFPQEPGSRFEPGVVRGYYLDFRLKAKRPTWPPAWLERAWLYVGIAQWGLGSFERYVSGDGPEWLDAAGNAGTYLLERQEQRGAHQGGWVHTTPYPHTFTLRPPWLSGITQGQAASLFVRLYLETDDERFADAARSALRPLTIKTSDGGVQAELDGRGFPEEFPTNPPSFVLNGAIAAFWGQYDVAVGLRDADARRDFAAGAETLAMNLHRWDTGYWSRYDLYPHRIANLASPWYHVLHVAQLRVMHQLDPRPEFATTAARFEQYAESRASRSRAFASKAAFRVLTPRTGRLRARLAAGRWRRLLTRR